MENALEKPIVILLKTWINPVIKLISAVIGIYSIVRLHGFYLSESEIIQSNNGILTSAGLFCAASIISFICAEEKKKFYISHYFESTFILFFIIYVFSLFFEISELFGLDQYRENIKLAFNIFFIIIQFLIILSFFYSFIKVNSKILSKRLNPNILLVLSFFLLIVLGALLLMLPKTTINETGLPLVKAIFMAASAVCVTGLTVLNVSTDLTFFGQTILLVLIQVGGIGIMTLTTLMSLLFSGTAGLRERANLKEILGDDNLSTLYGTLFKITAFTLGIEFIGFIFVYSNLPDFPNQFEKIFFAVFHVVSAFCNAGFALPGNNLADPIFAGSNTMIITIMVLIVLGGLGFPVLSEFYSKIVSKEKRRRPFSAYSKLVLTMTSILIFGGFCTSYIFESAYSLKGLDMGDKILHSFFLSITPRTAGFNTIDMARMSQVTVIFTIVLMFIGASPNSTGGGVKTTVLAVSFLNIYRILTGRKKMNLFKISLPESHVNKAYAVFTVSGIYIFSTTLLLQFIEIDTNISSFDILFETVSALNTVGLSLGITKMLSNPSLIILSIAMFIGRVGFLTIPAALIILRKQPKFEYVEKNIII